MPELDLERLEKFLEWETELYPELHDLILALIASWRKLNTASCAYCSAKFESDGSMLQVQEHIEVCPYHPIRAYKEELHLLREQLAAKNKEIERLRRVFRDMARQVPPKLWQYRDAWGDYLGWGKPEDSDYVTGVDMSNSGDVHEHGWAVGEWALLWELVEKAGLEEWLKEVPDAN